MLHSVAAGAAPSSAGGAGASAADQQRRAAKPLQPAGLAGVRTAEQEQRPHTGGGESQTALGGDGAGQQTLLLLLLQLGGRGDRTGKVVFLVDLCCSHCCCFMW